ncbi:hypothetical protein B0H14DRAFT_2644936 [Mycena olivaceomarginata]|nr:hypothetical protein B0H14DRAFT_2644936 [Mycena olivaceomarginata]
MRTSTLHPRPESERATSPPLRMSAPCPRVPGTSAPCPHVPRTSALCPHVPRLSAPRPHITSPVHRCHQISIHLCHRRTGKSPPPSTTDKGLASGDGVDAGGDEEPDRQDDDDDSGSNKDGNEDSNENDDKDSNEDEDEDETRTRTTATATTAAGNITPEARATATDIPGHPCSHPGARGLRRGKLKAARKILDEKVKEFEDLLEARAAELSEQLNIPLREVKQRLGHVTRYTDGRDYNEFAAKVWKRMKEMNVGKQKGERIQMPEVQKIVQAEGADACSRRITWHPREQNKGTRPSNNSAAKDAGAVASNISKEMDLLQHRTGARAFGVLAGGHFLQEVYKIDPVVFLVKYDSWTNLDRPGHQRRGRYFQRHTMPADLTVRRSEVAKMIESDLCNKTNNPNVKMNYKDYERVIQGGLGWTLVGWPEGATFVAPSNFKAGGAGHIRDPRGKRSRKAKGSTAKPKSAEEEPDAAETDADTDPEPAAGKKRKRQEDKGELQEGGSGKKSAGGKKAKQAEGKGKEQEKTKEKKGKGKEDSGGKKRKRGADGEQEEPPKKKKRKPFAHSTGHRSAEFVATDDDEPEGSTAGGNAVAGGSSGTGGSSGVAGGGSGGNAVAGGSTGPGTSSWDRMQEKRAKDLKAAAEAKQRMEANIAADIASGKIKPKTKRKRQPKSAKEIDEDDYDDEDSS